MRYFEMLEVDSRDYDPVAEPVGRARSVLLASLSELDAVLLILSYHDIYYAPGDGSWPDIDGPEMLQTIYDALAPGGVLGVVDHAAVPGTPNDDAGNELHRIDEESAKAEILAAGFVLDGEHDALRNPDDDRSKPMFVEGIRGYTDRFILRFRKPEN